MRKKRNDNNRPRQQPSQQKTPDSLGQAFIKIIWNLKAPWRIFFLLLAGTFVIGFLIWNSLDSAYRTKVISSFFGAKPSATELTRQQVQKRDFYVTMGDDYSIDDPRQALRYYKSAQQIDPQNEEIGKKVEHMEEKLKNGEAK